MIQSNYGQEDRRDESKREKIRGRQEDDVKVLDGGRRIDCQREGEEEGKLVGGIRDRPGWKV